MQFMMWRYVAYPANKCHHPWSWVNGEKYLKNPTLGFNCPSRRSVILEQYTLSIFHRMNPNPYLQNMRFKIDFYESISRRFLKRYFEGLRFLFLLNLHEHSTVKKKSRWFWVLFMVQTNGHDECGNNQDTIHKLKIKNKNTTSYFTQKYKKLKRYFFK